MKNNPTLIPLSKALKQFSPANRQHIAERARFIRVAMQLKALRKELDLAQGELATQIGKKREFVSRIESGRQNVTIDTLFKIAEATNKQFHFEFR